MTRSLILVLALARVVAAEPRATHLAIDDFSYAEWSSDGSGFYAIGTETWRRFDTSGKPRGAAETFCGLPDAATITRMPLSHRGLSPDGKLLAVMVQDNLPDAAPWIVDLAHCRARELDVPDGMVLALEWLANGTLVGTRVPGGRFTIDGSGRLASLCAPNSGYAVHADVDGRAILVGAERIYQVDAACKRRWSWSPWHDVNPRTWVRDFSVSPSGKHIAVVGGVDNRVRLYVLATDRDEVVERMIEPQPGPIVWLDEETLVYPVENGERGTSQRRLEALAWRTQKRRPLVPTKPSCSDSNADAPPRGGRLVFRRLCDDPRDSFVALVH